jgi:hypothetical protein
MIEHGWPVTGQVIAILDRMPCLGLLANQSSQPSLAREKRQLAQVLAVKPDQVEREQRRQRFTVIEGGRK